MFTPFQLSRELLGHSQDVRALTVLPSGHIVSGSRDNTIKIWNPANPSQTKTLQAHQNYVASLTPLPPTEENPTRIFASGGHDKVICVWDITADIEVNDNNNNNSAMQDVDSSPINFMLGHENAVTALSATVDGDIISGSWDKTVRIWKAGACAQELKGHEHAVWAVLGLPNGDIVTGSADSTIKIWRGAVGSMQCVKTLKLHKDCVRGLAAIPGIGFVSCSNDETLIVWSLDGDQLQTLHGHTAYVYSVDVLRASDDSYLIVSGSEDRTLKVWKDGECVQSITHPSGVWCVAAASGVGDIVSGCADGVARIWTQHKERLADPEVLQTYEANVASSSVHKSAIGDLDLSKLPGSDALATKRGTKDGEHLIIKTDSGGAELYSWSVGEDRWVKIGDVVESAGGGGGKQSLYGKDYDYVFDIDIGDGANKKLGYNKGENPYLVAHDFLLREELNPEFLDQVAKFIIQNADVTPMTLGGPAPVSDPYTGGSRYIPGTGSSSKTPAKPAPAKAPQSDSFTGNNRYVPYAAPTSSNPTISNSYFPQQTMTAYEGGNLAGLQTKLTEFSAVVTPPLAPEDLAQVNALLNVLKDTSKYHSSRVTEDQLRVVIKKLLVWPSANLLPVLDLVRLLFTHNNAAEILGSIKTTPSLYEILYNMAADITVPTNSMLALRSFANMFKLAGARKLIDANQSAIMDLMLVAIGSDNKNVTHAASTIALNFAVLYRTQPNETGIARLAAVLAKALANTALAQDVALRCVVAAGTLAANPAGFDLARMHFAALLPPLCASTDKDLGPAARALAQSIV